jgi:hypothetical protein
MQRAAAALQRRITAHHEAAHAVIAFQFGISVEEVATCNTIPANGHVRMSRAALISRAFDDGRDTKPP